MYELIDGNQSNVVKIVEWLSIIYFVHFLRGVNWSSLWNKSNSITNEKESNDEIDSIGWIMLHTIV